MRGLGVLYFLIKQNLFTFSVLRHELMNSEDNYDLHRALYGLLNLMPQTRAFRTLNDRLKTTADKKNFVGSPKKSAKAKVNVGNKHPKDIDFKSLIKEFHRIQLIHDEIQKAETSSDVLTEEQGAKLFEINNKELEMEDLPIVDDEYADFY